MMINGFDSCMRPYFHVWGLNIHAVPMQDNEGLYYNVSIGNGENRRDYFVDTPLDAYKLIKNLMK